jgi:hypothetical protein
MLLITLGAVSAQCVNLSDASTYGTKVVNVSSVLYVNEDTTLCTDTYSINVGSGTPVLQINASNMFLDCNQSTLNGADGDGYGIYMTGKENVTIMNCRATLYAYGLHVAAASKNINITNNFMYNSSQREISIDGDVNARANNFTFTNNNAWDSTQYGFYMEYLENSSFTNNTAYINTIYAFNLVSSNYNNLTNNNISGSTGAFGTGLYLSASDSNNVVNNTFFLNKRYAMELSGGSDYNVVENNTHYATADVGGFNEAGTGNNLTGNNVIWTNGDAYTLNGAGSILRNSIASRSGRSFVLTGAGTIAINNTGNNNGGTGAYIGANNIQFINNTIINASTSGGITTSSNTGLTIAGNTMNGDTGGFCYQIQASSSVFRDNVAFNCSTQGVYLYGSTNNITNFTISYCTNYGFYMDSQITNNQVSNSTVTKCSSGFYINSANFNNLSNNSAYNNTNHGFYFSGANSKNNTVSNSTSYSNGNGFYFDNSAFDNKMIDCIAYNNSQYGVYVTAATANGTNIHSYKNTLGDFYYAVSSGTAAIKTYMNNLTIDNSAGDFQNYTSVSFVQSGIGTFSYDMEWVANTTTMPAGTSTSFAQKFINITALGGAPTMDQINFTWLDSEAVGYKEKNFWLFKYNASGWTLQSGSPDTTNNVLSIGNFSPGSTYGIFQGIPDCVDLADSTTWGTKVVNVSYVLYVNQNTTLCTDTYSINASSSTGMLQINASNIFLDCNNSLMNGVTGNGYGIYMTAKENVTIMNCRATLYTYGMYIASSSKNINITNNFMYNNTQREISLTGTSGSRMDNFTITNNGAWNGSQYGFYVDYMENSTFTNNTAYLNRYHGFYILDSKWINIQNNNATNNSVGSSSYAGFDIYSSSSNNFTNNTMYGNGEGLYLYFDNGYNIVENNTANENSQYGFHVFNSASTNFTGNVVNNTNRIFSTGFYTSGCAECRVVNNYAGNCAGTGFSDTSTAIVLINNTAVNSGGSGGSFTVSSSGCTIVDNTAINTYVGAGFSLTGVPNCNITGNLANGTLTGSNCFALSGSSGGVNFSSNTAYNCAGSCFIISSSSVNLTNITGTVCTNYGLLLSGANYVNVNGATFSAANSGFYTTSTLLSNITNIVSYGNTYGFYLSGINVQNNTFTNATTYNNSVTGIYIPSSALDNRFVDSSTYSNTQYGIYINQGANLNATNIHAYNNSIAELYFSPWGSTAPDVSIRNLTIDNPLGNFENYTSIDLRQSVAGGFNDYVIGWSNNTYGLPTDMNRSFANKNINITNTSGTPTIDQVNFTWLDSEIAGYTESLFRLWKYNNSGWALMDGTPDTANNVLSMEGFIPGSLYGIFEAEPSGCANLSDDSTWGNMLVNNSGVLYVNGNTTLCADTYYLDAAAATSAIRLNASGVHLDCNQSILDGTDRDGYAIMTENLQYDAVENCTVRNYEWGIYLLTSNYTRIASNTAHNNTEHGIKFQGSNNNTAINNLAYNNTAGGGLQFDESSYNNASNNTAYGNAYGMIVLSNYNIVTGNTAWNNTYGYVTIGDFNTLDNNLAYGNAQHGFYVVDSDYNNFTNSTIYNNSAFGIYLGIFASSISSGNTFNNTFIHNQSSYILQEATAAQPNNFTDLTLGYNETIGLLNYPFLNATGMVLDSSDLILDPYFVSLDDATAPEANLSANITIYATNCSYPVLRDAGFPATLAGILANGTIYPTSKSCTDSVASFNVSGFSGYALGRFATTITFNVSPSTPITVGNETNLSCYADNAQATVEIFVNEVSAGSAVERFEYLQNLSVGFYNFTCNTTGNDNYTSANSTVAGYEVAKRNTTLALTIPSSPRAGAETNVSCSANNADVNISLYRDGVEVANGTVQVDDVAVLPAGTYIYVCNTTGSENYTSYSAEGTLTVQRPPSSSPSPAPQCYLEVEVNESVPVGERTSLQVFRYSDGDSERTSLYSASVTITHGGNVSTLTTGTDGRVGFVPPTPGTYSYSATFGDCEDAEGSFIAVEAPAQEAEQPQPPEQPPEQPAEGEQAPGQSTGGEPVGTGVPPTPECTSDGDCAAGFGCRNGSCVETAGQPGAEGEETPGTGTPSSQPTPAMVPWWAWLLVVIIGAYAYWYFKIRKKA